MKKLLLIPLLFYSVFLYSQEYSEVVQVPGKNADQLYDATLEWFALTFKSANDVIQLRDPIDKKIIGKGLRNTGYYINKIYIPINLYFTLSVQFKDDRYKYFIQSTEIKSSSGEIYTFELIKEITTMEGLRNYYKIKKISPFIVGERQMQKNIESNKIFLVTMDDELKNIINDLKFSLKNINIEDNW